MTTEDEIEENQAALSRLKRSETLNFESCLLLKYSLTGLWMFVKFVCSIFRSNKSTTKQFYGLIAISGVDSGAVVWKANASGVWVNKAVIKVTVAGKKLSVIWRCVAVNVNVSMYCTRVMQCNTPSEWLSASFVTKCLNENKCWWWQGHDDMVDADLLFYYSIFGWYWCDYIDR